jgi:hypothetical protein
MLLIAILTTAGCAVSFNGHSNAGARTPHATASTTDDGVKVWDLRTRPTAQDVGMLDDQDYVAYESDTARTVRFLLLEGKVLQTELYLVVFDRITAPATTDRTVVTGVDFRAKPMPLDACAVMTESLRSFGLTTSAVDAWQARIEARPTDGPSADRRIEGGANTTIGHLSAGVGGVYDPLDGDDSVTTKYRINLS